MLSGWPRVSEVFAQNELLALHRAGLLAAVLATKPGEPELRHPAGRELDPLVTLLPYGDAETQADAAARHLARIGGITGVHGYFAHRPAAVAAGAARRLGIRYGFSTHALDARRVPRAQLAALGAGAAVVVCCNAETAGELHAAGVEPRMVAHGVDLAAFPVTPPPDGPGTALLGVGRFVPKKGFAVLIAALARTTTPHLLCLVGDGPLRGELATAVEEHGLGDRVVLAPRRTHATLPGAYAAADVVVVPSVVAPDGDRDGLPNVVLEAMASGRPVVASDVAAIGSAVAHGVTGLLVPPGDPDKLALALDELAADPARRRAMGRAGRAAVAERFALDRCTATLRDLLERSYG